MATLQNEAHWRDSARPTRFFIWDGKLAFPILFPLFYPRTYWTWLFAIAAMIIFSVLNRYGLSPLVFLRLARSKIAGRRKLVEPLGE